VALRSLDTATAHRHWIHNRTQVSPRAITPRYFTAAMRAAAPHGIIPV
jgi:hypothetical protein